MKPLLSIFFILIHTSVSLKILGIFPTTSKSHYILARALMRGLAEKSHDVTVINFFGEKEPPKNGTYRDILLTTNPNQEGAKPRFKFDDFKVNEMSFITYQLTMNALGNKLTETFFSHPNVQQLLKSNENFDVVIVEQFVNDALKVFAYHYKAPLVIFSATGTNSWLNPLVANPASPSFVPQANIIFDYRNFFHRLRNTIIHIFGYLNRHLIFFPAQDKIMKKYFPDAPDFDDIIYNASLVLVNSDWSTNIAVPRVPNIVDIGGFHVESPQKLPKDLQEFLDNAREGAILFSMGSVLQSVNLTPGKRDAFVKVFSKLKMNVLWKWEADTLPGQPPNVKIGKWLPQKDILAHPNIKAFITHGGLLSFTESVYHSVPILAIPVWVDQVWNAAAAQSFGCGRYIPLKNLNEHTLSEALNDVLNNSKYRDTMKRRSKIMNDRRHNQIDDADYWIQYVVRHQGAPHLRVPGLNLTWYQYLGLDVAVFLFAVMFVIIYFVHFLVKKVLLCKSKNAKIKEC